MDFFSGPTALLKAQRLSNFGKFWRKMIIKQQQCLDCCKTELKIWCPTFIQGPMFILFPKFSRPYVFFLPYVYSGLYSTLTTVLLNYLIHCHLLKVAWSRKVFHFDSILQKTCQITILRLKFRIYCSSLRKLNRNITSYSR